MQSASADGGLPLTPARHAGRETWLAANFGVATIRDPQRGMCVVAQRAFEPGEVILSSEPYEFVLFPALKDERCHECFLRTDKLLRCASCKLARYCSAACQQRAWQAHHKFECVIQAELEHMCAQLPPVAQQELSLLMRVALKKMAQTPTTDEKEEAGGGDAGGGGGGEAGGGCEYVPDYDDVLAMPAHTSAVLRLDPQRSAGNKYLAQMATTLMQLPKLRKKKALQFEKLPSVTELCGLLATFAANDFGIWDELLVALGAGVFPLGALLNHSCQPNTVLYYHPSSHRQTIRCIRRIEAGEHLCHAYIDLASTSPKRREKLRVIYHFTCDCLRCVQPPHILDERLEPPAAGDKEQKKREKDEELVSRYIRALDMADSVSDITDACNDLAAAEKRLMASGGREGEETVDLLLVRLWSSLLQGWIEAGNAQSAIDACSSLVRAYRGIYPANHPLLGLQLYTLGNLQQDSGSGDVGLEALSEAKAILTVTHGAQSKMVHGLEQLIHSAQ